MKRRKFIGVRYIGFALAFSIALAGCGKGCGKQAGGPEKGSLELIPGDSNIVMGMNWTKISESPLGGKMTAGVPPEVAPFLKEVSSVVIGMNVKGMEKGPKDFVGVISGKLDSAKLLAQLGEQAKKDGTTVTDEDYEGVKIHSTAKDAQFAVAFIENKGVFGSKDALKKAIDLTKKKGDSIEKNKAMMDLINGMDKNKMVWAVATIPEGLIPAGEGGPGNPMASLSGLKAIDLALDYTDSLILDLGILTAAKENAQQMMTMANSYKTLFGTSLAMKDPTMGKVLNGLTIDAKEDKVILTLKLDKATVDELAKKAADKQGMMPGTGDTPPAGAMDAAPPAPPAPPAMDAAAPPAPPVPAPQ